MCDSAKEGLATGLEAGKTRWKNEVVELNG